MYRSAFHLRERRPLSSTPEHIVAKVPDAIRPAPDMRPESVGLFEIVHRD